MRAGSDTCRFHSTNFRSVDRRYNLIVVQISTEGEGHCKTSTPAMQSLGRKYEKNLCIKCQKNVVLVQFFLNNTAHRILLSESSQQTEFPPPRTQCYRSKAIFVCQRQACEGHAPLLCWWQQAAARLHAPRTHPALSAADLGSDLAPHSHQCLGCCLHLFQPFLHRHKFST